MLETGHYILLVVILFVIGLAFAKACDNAGYSVERKKKFLRGYTLLVSLWVVYLFIIGKSGVIATFELPPRLPQFVILPAFIIIFWFFNAKRFKEIINAFPIELTVYIQSFRIFVELLILGLYYRGIGPEQITFEGNNFDIVAGLTAPIIAYLVYKRKILGHFEIIVWNILSIILLTNIVGIFLTLAFKPEVWGYDVTPISLEFTEPPFIYIAGVFMPVAVFLHIFSLKKSFVAISKKASK
ncbi:MAG: hypothetical protein H6551_05220 [Chitinophagales bacterium]|nr:hypothetical protein [Chitinophagaceae bacterium]MCB9064529.1 hypothetical protein [Chitinophagales bacterium]